MKQFRRRAVVGGLAALSFVAFAKAEPRPVLKAATQQSVRATTMRSNRPLVTSDFLRYVAEPEAKGRPRLEASIVTLKGEDGFTVDLVSAVHVADKSFFQDLGNRFPGYDAVLYEMIKHKGASVPRPGQSSGSGVSMIQRFMTDALDLTFQLDEVDYTAANFVHADLDVETFFRKQEERGESLMGIMLKSMLREMAKDQASSSAPPPDLGQLLWALKQPDKHRQLKLMLARSFGDIESQMAGMDGPDGSAILTDRNDACLEVLKRERAAGKKRVAIFYGAAHMPDMTAKLIKNEHLTISGHEWLTAWDMTAPPSTQSATRPTK